ncbi:LPS export ABC transporter periplasmic protein LptC [Motilimonas cestriensis]|uniref:Lipopolysaccharide export system protein LptC n=1 Tax=Motilimonas cestriensis TaxID=2742685 RepID=A0ABS8WAL1_9GAMM|nr:LPS export ABC transporter periplasmic protein LptC [Motilimonas cestriensis]MCE2596064.1 LPS export ABC transporter periplasmic protein LptC [Motilimonas cestriensis]
MKKLNIWLSVLFIVSLAAWQFFKRSETPIAERDPSEAYFIANEVKGAVFTQTGQIDYRLFATQMHYYQQDLKTIFTKPVLLLFRNEDKTQWQITGDDGILFDQHTFELSNNVTITNLTHDQHINLITTDKLTLDLIKNEIHSDDLVTLYGDQMQQKGTGLFGQLSGKTISLLNQVTATYLNEKP